MSILERLPALQIALQELRRIQETRKKLTMAEGNVIGLATVKAFKTEKRFEQENEAKVSIKKKLGKLYLTCGSIVTVPCDLILYGNSVNNSVTVYIKENNLIQFKNIIFEMPSIKEVDDFITKVKLPQKPPVNTYQHDGNVTSSSSDSDSGRSVTKGVNNSFDSDDPSSSSSSVEDLC